MAIAVLHEVEPYRLITDGRGRYAVIEARNGRVYSLHCHDRREAPDTPEGMELVVGDGWRAHDRASQRFLSMVRGERRYEEEIW